MSAVQKSLIVDYQLLVRAELQKSQISTGPGVVHRWHHRHGQEQGQRSGASAARHGAEGQVHVHHARRGELHFMITLSQNKPIICLRTSSVLFYNYHSNPNKLNHFVKKHS